MKVNKQNIRIKHDGFEHQKGGFKHKTLLSVKNGDLIWQNHDLNITTWVLTTRNGELMVD